MANLQPVSFTSPGYDYGAELSEIQRRQSLAEALRQQSMEPIQQQSGGRYTVPISPWQGLAKIGQGAASGIQAARAQQEQRSLSERAQGDYRRMLAEGLQQLQGTPASEDVAGNISPAQPPNAAAAMGTFGSHPMGAQFIPAAMQQLQREQLAKTLGGAPQPTKPPPAYGQPGFDPSAKPTPTGQRSGGPAGGIPMEAWLQVDPTGKSYMEQLAKDNQLVNIRPGGTAYRPGVGPEYIAPNLPPGSAPINPTQPQAGVQPIPGASGVAGLMAGATAGSQAAARAPWEFEHVTTPTGANVPVSRASLAGGQQPGAQPSAGGGSPSRPSSLGQTTYGHEFSRQAAEASSKYVDELRSDARSSVDQNRMINELDASLKDFGPGKAAAMRKAIAQWQVQMGLGGDEAKQIAASAETGDKLVGQLVSNALKKLSARPTQMEFQIFKDQYVPNLAMTPQGAQQVINFMRQQNNLSAQKYQKFNDWRRQQQPDTDFRDFDLHWNPQAAQAPLSSSQSFPNTGGGGAAPNAQAIVDELRRRGDVK